MKTLYLIKDDRDRFAIEVDLISEAKVYLLRYGELETFGYTKECNTSGCVIEKNGVEIEVEISGNMIVKYR